MIPSSTSYTISIFTRNPDIAAYILKHREHLWNYRFWQESRSIWKIQGSLQWNKNVHVNAVKGEQLLKCHEILSICVNLNSCRLIFRPFVCGRWKYSKFLPRCNGIFALKNIIQRAKWTYMFSRPYFADRSF